MSPRPNSKRSPHARARAFIGSLGIALSTGCSTHLLGLEYDVPEIGVLPVETDVRLGVTSFRDERGTAPDWLGAIRGGYGNPLKKLRTRVPTAELVTQAFRDALAIRGLLVPGQGGGLVVTGEVRKLDCSYYVNREAHAHILVRVIEASSQKKVFEKLYQADQREGGMGAGIFGSVDTLHRLAERTLREAIDNATDDPEFRRAIGVPGG